MNLFQHMVFKYEKRWLLVEVDLPQPFGQKQGL